MYIMNEAFQRAMAKTAREREHLEERMHFEEMGMNPGNAIEDKLPFKIVLMNPDGSAPKPHAHIMEGGGSGKELGAFVITDNPPSVIEDLVPYTQGGHKGLKKIPDEWQELIIQWSIKISRLDPFRTNWQCLQQQYYLNAYMTHVNL